MTSEEREKEDQLARAAVKARQPLDSTGLVKPHQRLFLSGENNTMIRLRKNDIEAF